MQCTFGQLPAQLSRGLAPVYLICGDEPYQFGEAARLVREGARRGGFDEREVLDADGSFDWNRLLAAADAMSLFSARKLIELRLNAGKLGKDGSEAVRGYCDRLCADNLLLILAPALERKDLQAQWAKRVDAVGVQVQVWPLREKELEPWLVQRLQAVGFQPGPGVAALLAERSEGNLLAAVQEIEKLRLLHEPGQLLVEDLLGNLADSARFDLFALTDAVLAGDRARAQRVLAVLRAEGTADILVLWALARELRLLAEVASVVARRASPSALFAANRVPRMRQDGLERAARRLSPGVLRRLLQHCSRVDLAIKGMAAGDPWQRLALIADALCTGDLRTLAAAP